MIYALEQFIEEAIQLELNAAEIYALFSETIPEDADFWAGLSWEERNHASLLKTGKDALIPLEQFPLEILPGFIQTLTDTNLWLKALKDEYAEKPPDRRTAFDTAIKIEKSAGEQHFQRVMETPSESNVVKIFQELCQDDIHHLRRIKEYMQNSFETKGAEREQRKILVAMDDDAVAKLLEAIMATEGEVDIVRNGRDGLQKIKERYYDLIISSVEMPILDGLKFFQEAKKITPELHKRFLFFTGGPTPERLAFFNRENLRYLAKPSTITEIRETALSLLA